LLELVKEAGSNWVEHKDARLGAALAYYSIFSIGPVIVIAIAVAGLIFGQDAVRGEVSAQIRGLLGDTGATAVQSMLADASQPRSGMLATVLGVGALLFAAVGVVVQLKDALNTVWGVEAKKGGLWQFIRTYIVSLAGVLSLGFLLLVSLLVSTSLAAGSKYLTPYLPEVLLQSVSSAVSLAFFAALFAMMFKCRRQSPTTTSKLRPCFPRVSTYLKLRESFRARAYVAQLHLIHSTNFMRAAPLDHV
jgi:membrane protein